MVCLAVPDAYDDFATRKIHFEEIEEIVQRKLCRRRSDIFEGMCTE